MKICTRKPKLLLGIQVLILVLIVGGILLGKRLANEDPGSLMMSGECGSWQLFQGWGQASLCNGRVGKADWTRMELSFGLSPKPSQESSNADTPLLKGKAASQDKEESKGGSVSDRVKRSAEMMGINATSSVQSTPSSGEHSEEQAGQGDQGGPAGGRSEGEGKEPTQGDPSSQGGMPEELSKTPQKEASGSIGLPSESNKTLEEKGASSEGQQKHYGGAPTKEGPSEGGTETKPRQTPKDEEVPSGADAETTPKQTPKKEEAPKKESTHESVTNDLTFEEAPKEEFGCDRSSWMTDVCRLNGTVRIQTGSTVVEVYTHREEPLGPSMRVRPQPRKYDADMMAARITEYELVSKNMQELEPRGSPQCDHVSDVPGIVFSTGGWTGNAFHEFTDVLIPLFVSTERYHRKVRLFVSDAPEPWLRKYQRFLEIFTEFPLVNLGEGGVSWCLERLTVGLEIHGYLTVDPERMPGGVRLARMSEMFAQHLGMVSNNRVDNNRVKDTPVEGNQVNGSPIENGELRGEADAQDSSQEAATRINKTGLSGQRKLRMGIVRRNGSGRVIENHDRVAQIAEEEGFQVEELSFSYESPSLEEVFRTVQGLDVLMGVHGAALTYFVFMRPGAALIQVVPWGVRRVAEVYDGMPAREHGLHYIAYEIEAAESSLLDKYALDDPVMADTGSVWRGGWADGDRLYLREQNVRLKEERVRGVFREARQTLLGHGGVTETVDRL
ncbi:Glycosyltransferase family 61 protein [Klebsormidium nitens]|uniref:Glycosyltransferase family 61 protein n=1 Tax=Klebsormidium nitens TaxID=105231 RepID=A0A1Y1IHH3_KLENI|nr:Glycosyltransferase family 61 protein [Klebsormidium nitens]|eukprot:GAQ89522.1 Glycosyltransferase family 61 protein [Klebsormidium nitens]